MRRHKSLYSSVSTNGIGKLNTNLFPVWNVYKSMMCKYVDMFAKFVQMEGYSKLSSLLSIWAEKLNMWKYQYV